MFASITKLNFLLSSNYYRRYADLLRSQNNVVKTSLHEITLEEFHSY